MSESKLLPCPFCGELLVENNNQADLYVKRYGTHWSHPMGSCFLEDMEVGPSQVDDWNMRAQPSVQGGGDA